MSTLTIPILAWLLLPQPFGRATSGSSQVPKRVKADLVRINDDGSINLDNGRVVRLAGVTMRTEKETDEPDLLKLFNSIARHETARVEVEYDNIGDAAVIWYVQRIAYRDLYHPLVAIRTAFLPKTTKLTLNELAIALGIAQFDPKDAGRTMSDSNRARCEAAAQKAEDARWSTNAYKPLRSYRDGADEGFIFRHWDGYRARITMADKLAQDLALSESSDFKRLLANTTVDQAGREAMLLDALKSENVFIRRFATRQFRELDSALQSSTLAQLIDGLTKEPFGDVRYQLVLVFARHGRTSDEVRQALSATAQRDADERVRRAAQEALKQGFD